VLILRCCFNVNQYIPTLKRISLYRFVNLRSVDYTMLIHGHAFRRAGASVAAVGIRVGNESGQRTIFGAADADTSPPGAVFRSNAARFRIGDIHNVVLIDGRSHWAD